jgi:hypothetical protein
VDFTHADRGKRPQRELRQLVDESVWLRAYDSETVFKQVGVVQCRCSESSTRPQENKCKFAAVTLARCPAYTPARLSSPWRRAALLHAISCQIFGLDVVHAGNNLLFRRHCSENRRVLPSNGTKKNPNKANSTACSLPKRLVLVSRKYTRALCLASSPAVYASQDPLTRLA